MRAIPHLSNLIKKKYNPDMQEKGYSSNKEVLSCWMFYITFIWLLTCHKPVSDANQNKLSNARHICWFC